MFPFDLLKSAARKIDQIHKSVSRLHDSLLFVRDALGRIETRQCGLLASNALQDHEFKVWSQWGEDGILQHLLRHVQVPNKVFVEFGVENYTEANTRFLLTQHQWSGLILDGSAEHIASIRRDPIYWRHNLKAINAFITRENINDLLRENGLSGEIGLLSVDIDGNDYWVWEAITEVQPALVIAEYNSLFGPDRAVTVPYEPAFRRAEAHTSTSYYGASLAALAGLARRKGYAFVGSNSAGNNAFFIERSRLCEPLREVAVAEGYVRRAFREARDAQGHLLFPSHEEEAAMVNALPLIEVAP